MTTINLLEVQLLDRLLQAFEPFKENPWFTLSVADNMGAISDHVEVARKVTEPDEETKKFQKDKEQLVKKYATKDETGKPVTRQVPNRDDMFIYDMDESAKVLLEMETEELLASKYPTLAARLLEKEENIKEALKRKVEIQFSPIKMSDVPEECRKTVLGANAVTFLRKFGILDFDLVR